MPLKQGCWFLSILQGMDQQNEIQQLQEELLQLHTQLKEQQQKISALHKKLLQLSSADKEPAASSTPVKPQWKLENFIGLRLIHFIGIVVLVIGISIGVKYAIDKNLISAGLRIALAYAAGITLYILSVRLKNLYTVFSAILFSGGMASLYFTTYAAFVYYAMMPFGVAFLIMIVFTVFTVYQAIVYNRQEIALLGLVGAYAIPFLISKNADNPALFFLYITIINLGVVYLCVRKPWKNVGRVAQAITWILFLAWAGMRFNLKQQGIALLFMSLFFVLFLFNAVSERVVQKQPLLRSSVYQIAVNNIALYIAALFVFGNAFADANLAKITIILSVLVALQAAAFHYVWKEDYTKRVMAAFAFLLFILFIAFQWSGLTVTLLWLLTAVVVFALGMLRKQAALRMTSIILMGVTLFKLVVLDSMTFSTVQKVIAYLILGVLLLVVSYFYQKYKQHLFNDI